MAATRPLGLRNRTARIVVGLILAVTFCVECRQAAIRAGNSDRGFIAELETPAIAAEAPVADADHSDPILTLAKTDPLALLRLALDRYERSVRDYTCTFTKQECINGRMSQEQQIEVKFKEDPFSVLMHWKRNPGAARRVLYVAGRWQKDDKPLAVVEPQGAIARLLVKSVYRPIHGEDAQKASRRTIDQFGFGNTLRLILKYSEIAAERGELSLKYVGTSQVDGRPTYVFERRLPYTGEDGFYPDRVLVVHLDQEWLLPTECFCFADDAKQQLLGHYKLTNVRLNVGLTDEDFTRQANGL